jgi:Putative peptidoglycan binding domain
MKKLICSVCIAGLTLATTALSANRSHGNGGFAAAPVHRSAPSAAIGMPGMSRQVMSAPHVQRSFSRAPFREQTYRSTPRVRSNAVVHNNTAVRNRTVNTRVRSNIANPTARANANARVRNNLTVNRERSFARNRNVNVANVAVNRNRTRNAVVTNNWRGSQFQGRNYAAFRNYNRQWHNRGWWRNHFNTIVFVGGGWWYWDNDYWYPAWGYDASAYYPYDGPIYGYSNVGPGQVVANVQSQLSREGYYSGPIDGVLGPMTRQAIAAFQADHGLAVTSTVDEPTVASLGLS